MPTQMIRLSSRESLDHSPNSSRTSIDTEAASVDNLILHKHNDSDVSLNDLDNRFYNLDQRLDNLHQKSVYPDGGEGWLVLAACTTINFFYLGQVYSFGVYQSELEKQGVAPTWKLAFVSGLATGTMALISVPAMLAIDYTSHKHVALTGSILLGLGQIASSFTTNNMPGLFATQGLVVGIGLACCLIVGYPYTQEYL